MMVKLPKTPKFWQSRGFLCGMLIPASYLYGIIQQIYKKCLPPALGVNVPILCVGGVVAGGSGKTPAVRAVIDLLMKNGVYHTPIILMRGYGGTQNSPVMVDPNHHTWRDVGDEAMLHALKSPVVVSKNRADGAVFALKTLKPDLIILDDGLQNEQVAKTCSLLVVDSHYGIGNQSLLPAGPLREPWADALKKMNAILLIGDGDFIPATSHPIFRAKLVVDISPLKAGDAVFGFAGIGHPEKFERSLRGAGLDVRGFVAFADHHPFDVHDVSSLKAQAKHHGARLVTTQKDFMRLSPAFRAEVTPIPAQLVFDSPDTVLTFLQKHLKNA